MFLAWCMVAHACEKSFCLPAPTTNHLKRDSGLISMRLGGKGSNKMFNHAIGLPIMQRSGSRGVFAPRSTERMKAAALRKHEKPTYPSISLQEAKLAV